MDTPWFLQHLGLDGQADARAVKRAYAARLKLIDMQAEPVAFERLRQAYEQALAWHGSREPERSAVGAASPEPSNLPVERPHEETVVLANSQARPASPDPGPLVVRAYADIAERLPVESSRLAELLHNATQPLRLHSLEAWRLFQCRLIDALAQGELPQREQLLDAAERFFGWRELGQLENLRQHGLWVYQVMDQRLAWQTMPHAQRVALAKVIDIVAAGRWSWPTLGTHSDTVKALQARFPLWLQLRMDKAILQRWDARASALPFQRFWHWRRQRAQQKRSAANGSTAALRTATLLFVGLIGFFSLIAKYGGTSNERPASEGLRVMRSLGMDPNAPAPGQPTAPSPRTPCEAPPPPLLASGAAGEAARRGGFRHAPGCPDLQAWPGGPSIPSRR